MNSRFHWKIYLKDLGNGIRESILIFLVVFLASSLLSLSLFLFDNSYVEKQLVESIPIEYKISNKDLLLNPKKTVELNGNSENRALLENYRNYSEPFFSALNELCESGNIKSYSYNLVQIFFYYYEMAEDDDFVMGEFLLELYSIPSIEFIDDHQLEIISGNAEDIYRISNGIIVSSRQTINDADGRDRKVKVGDIIESEVSDRVTIEFEVVAIYKSVKRFDFSYGDDDSFINSDAGLILQSDMLALLDENPEIYYHIESGNPLFHCFNPIAVNAISFTCKDIESSKLFEKELEAFKHEMEVYAHSSRMPDYNIKIIYPEYESVLQSITRIRSIYILIFIAIALMLIFLFYSLISYCQNKRRREIFIYESLGKQRKKIYGWYAVLYLIVSVPASILGSIPGIYLSNAVNRSILDTSVKMQEELLKYSNNGRIIEVMNESLSFPLPSALRCLAVMLITVFIISIIIIFFGFITTRMILTDRSQNALRGGN